MTNTIIFISIFTFQLLLKGVGDWWYKKYKKKIINHRLSAVIDLIIYIIAGYFFICIPSRSTGDCSVLFMMGVLWTTLSARGILYDLLYNLINKHKWNHCGDSARLDIKKDLIDGKDDNICEWGLVLNIILLLIGINLMVWF